MCNETLVQSEMYKDVEIQIHRDDTPCNPRHEWDNLGTMVCWHSRYDLGDKDHGFERYSPEEFTEEINDKNSIMLPLYLYDHSGITMNTSGFSCQWDSGQVGYIFITKEKIRAEYGWKRITKKRKAKIIQYLKNEVETYDNYLTGSVYGYVVENELKGINDSCWGYYGDTEDCITAAKESIDYALTPRPHNVNVSQVSLN